MPSHLIARTKAGQMAMDARREDGRDDYVVLHPPGLRYLPIAQAVGLSVHSDRVVMTALGRATTLSSFLPGTAHFCWTRQPKRAPRSWLVAGEPCMPWRYQECRLSRTLCDCWKRPQ